MIAVGIIARPGEDAVTVRLCDGWTGKIRDVVFRPGERIPGRGDVELIARLASEVEALLAPPATAT